MTGSVIAGSSGKERCFGMIRQRFASQTEHLIIINQRNLSTDGYVIGYVQSNRCAGRLGAENVKVAYDADPSGSGVDHAGMMELDYLRNACFADCHIRQNENRK